MKNKISTFSWIIGAVVLAVFLRVVFIGVFKVPTVTMAPTLLSGDFVISNKLAYGFKDKLPDRGDVIVFTRSEKLGQSYIKRVVAVPGDRLIIKNGELIINDKKCTYNVVSGSQNSVTSNSENPNLVIENFEVIKEDCLGSTREILRALTGQLRNSEVIDVTLKPREFYVLGDNRDASEDSRDWGPITSDQVSGRVQIIWLSIGSTQDSISKEKGFRFSRFLTKIH